MKTRDPSIDNLRGILILLVVLAHLIEPFVLNGNDPIARMAYILITAMNMPLFIGVSGYLSSTEFGPKERAKIVLNLVIPYLVVQLAFRIFDAFALGNDFIPNFTTPYWLLYFLMCLAIWRIIMPMWMTLRWPLATAIVLSLIVGMMNDVGYYLSLSRIFYFFPFFIVGFQLKDSKYKLADLSRYWHVGLIVICISCILIWTLIPETYNVRWLYGSNSYNKLGFGKLEGMLMRIVHYCAITVLVVAILTCIPKKPTFFTFFGIYTLPIYIYHGFIVKLLVHQTPYTTIPLWLIIPVSLGLTAIICIAVTRAPMRQALDSILSGGGQFKKFFKSN